LSTHSPPAPTPESTLQLVERCRNGDLTAFDEIVALHQNRIYNLCFWSLGDADEAADATQETFLRAWRAIARFRGESAFATWLHRIALNVTHDAARRRGRAPLPFSATTSTDDEELSGTDPPDLTPGPGEIAAQHERRLAVRRALAALPENHRTVLVLFDIEGYSYEEAAALLQLPMGTLKSRLNRARVALRERLEDCRELFEEGASPTF
jgi:RNA polymerase sigma-70 factor (ECF subfamily)